MKHANLLIAAATAASLGSCATTVTPQQAASPQLRDTAVVTAAAVTISPDVKDNHIETAEAAAFARKTFSSVMTRFAADTGRRAECIHNCEGRFPTFEVRRVDGRTPVPNQFDPDVFYVTFGIERLVRHTHHDPLFDRIVGYTPDISVTFLPCFSEQKLVFDNGEWQKFAEANPSKARRVFEQQPVCRDGLQSPLELRFMRILTAQARVLRGSWLDRVIALDGHLYHMDSGQADDFIDYEILPASD